MTDPTKQPSDFDADTLDALAADLRSAVGSDNAVTSGELADRHFPDDSSGNPKTREAIKVLMRSRKLPVIGGGDGYYIPEHNEPVSAAVQSLQSRKDGIDERIQLLIDNWEAWRSEPATDGGLSKQERERIKADPVLELSDFEEGRL
jgi:hypothetical protein